MEANQNIAMPVSHQISEQQMFRLIEEQQKANMSVRASYEQYQIAPSYKTLQKFEN